jgi:hypothetical protein
MGSVLRSDQSSVPDLMLTSSDATEAFEGRFRLKEDLDLPSLFWNDLGDLLDVEVAAQFMNSLNHGQMPEKVIKPFVARVQRLLSDSQKQPGLSEKASENLRYLLAQAFGLLGFATEKTEYDRQDIAICDALIEAYQHRPNDVDRIDYLEERTNAEIQLAQVEHRDVAVDLLNRAIADLRLDLESIDSSVKTEAKEIPPPPTFDLDGFIASKRVAVLEKSGIALEILGNLTSDDAKVRNSAVDYQEAAQACYRGKSAPMLALSMFDLGRVLNQLGEKERRTDYLVSAANAFRQSAKVFSRLGIPAMTDRANKALAAILISLGERDSGVSGTDKLQEAVDVSREILRNEQEKKEVASQF